MKRKIIALVMSGVMVLGSGSAVFAESTAAENTDTQSIAEEQLDTFLGELLGSEDGESLDFEALMGSVTDENGELDLEGLFGSVTDENGELDIEGLFGSVTDENGELDLKGLFGSLTGSEDGSFDISALLGSFLGGEEGSFDLNSLLSSFLGGEDGLDLQMLIGSLFDENGSFNLDGILEMFGVDAGSLDLKGILETVASIGGASFTKELQNLETEAGVTDAEEELSVEDVEAMVNELIANPEEATSLVDSLLKEDGIGATLLNALGSTDETISGVVDSIKDDSGEYSLERLVETFGTIEGNDNGISIGGQEITQEEIEGVVTQLLGLFGVTEDASAEAAA